MAGTRREDDVVIRERRPADDAAIRRLNEAAFGGTYEATLIEDLRSAGLAALELMAWEEAEIAGHILFSRLDVTLDERPISALALAPVAVRPDRQRQGIGSALIREGLTRAGQRGWQAVILLGHPGYYPRFGFSAALARKLRGPFSGEAFMALELVPGALAGAKGKVVYPAAFGSVVRRPPASGSESSRRR
jgi:putative acetyltransferase